MNAKVLFHTTILIALGIALGCILATQLHSSGFAAASTQAGERDDVAANQELATMKAELESMKGKLPGQAHAMIDVAYHFTNLWFAGQRGNWPLAQFYFNEVRSHLRWAVRIIPVRKDSAGREIQLTAILEAIENSPMKQLEDSIQAKERARFVTAYEATLAGCYSCHKAVEKDYLQLKIPDHPAEAILDFSPVPAETSR
jgi:hypothetical protein